MSKHCPSSVALDAFRLGFDRTAADHVQKCPHCTAWLAAQERLESEVAHLWVPVGAPVEPAPARPKGTRWKYFLGLGLPLAAVAATILFMVIPRTPTETAKGGPVPVEIARLSNGVLSWLSPESVLKPNDSIRFFVHRNDPDDRYVLIGSVDGSRQLAHFYPADANGCGLSLPASGEALEGSIVIDEAPGPERIVVVLSHQPLCWTSVDDAVKRIGLSEPLTDGLPSNGVHTTRLIFEKQPENPL